MTTGTSQSVYGANFGGTATENYERYFVPSIGGPLAADLIEEAKLREGERVLDVACGTGIVARLAAQAVGAKGSVAGLDINPGMLAIARAIALPPGSAAIRWYETTAEAMPLPDASVDVVLCQLGLQFVSDKQAALREMRRVLAPGGRALVSVPTPTPFFEGLETALAQRVPAAAGFVQMVFSLNNPAKIESLFRAAGFVDVIVRAEPKQLDLPSPQDFLWQYVHSTPISGMLGEHDEEARAALERHIVAAWQPWVVDGGMRHEQGMIITTARSAR